MKANIHLVPLLGLALWPASIPAMAHHATSTFYAEDAVELSGKIVEVIWANPHGIIVIQDDKGEYFVGEMASILSLASQGLRSAQLPVGMAITVDARPSRDGTNRIHIDAISSDGNSIYRSPDI